MRHRLISAAALLVVAVLAGTVVAAGATKSRGTPLSDSATCTDWRSATVTQQLAYAQSYVNTHPPLTSSAWDAASVRGLLNTDCRHAAYLGETDEVDLVGALKHEF